MRCSGGGGALVHYLRVLLGQKENFTVYFLWKGEHYYSETRHNDLFSPLQSFSKETLKKIGPKSARKY